MRRIGCLLLVFILMFSGCVSTIDEEQEQIEPYEPTPVVIEPHNPALSVDESGYTSGAPLESESLDTTNEMQDEKDIIQEEELSIIDEELENRITELLAGMTIEEKVAQLFFVRTGDMNLGYPVGGVILFSEDIVDEGQLRQLIATLHEESRFPLFVGVDEEGGPLVARVGNSNIAVQQFPNMLEIGDLGDASRAFEVGDSIGSYLNDLGFNVNFAPVADIFSNPANTVIGARSFGTTADLVAQMVVQVVEGLQGQGVSATLKHFPGHGNTYEDSHFQRAVTNKTLDELREMEFLPFIAGIERGVHMVMTGHVAVPAVTNDYTPATLSHLLIQEILRQELGFEGIVISDAMDMGAIVNHYGSGEAAVRFLQAGGDMILMPHNFTEARQAVLTAVYNQELTVERLDESLRRIYRIKLTQ